MPYFSVLLPVCNSKHTISDCLHSIDVQSFKDFDVLVLVNNSEDESFEICSSFCSTRSNFHLINLYKSQPSLPDVLNFGISYLRGNCKYIVRHDSDDFMLNTRLENTYRSICSSHSEPLIHCGNAYINRQNSLYFPELRSISDYQIKQVLLLESPFIHPAIAFKSSIPYLYDRRFIYAQDLKFFIDNMFMGPYSFSPTPYIYYTIIPPSTHKRLFQLTLHDLAINTLHQKLIHGFNFRVSHQLRCKFITDENRMYPPISDVILQSSLHDLYTQFHNSYQSTSF